MTPTPDEVAALVKRLRDWIADADLSDGDLRHDWRKIVAQCSEAADALESLSPPAGMVMAPTREELLGAIARGWCHPVNECKVMDTDLAEAINIEVRGLLSRPQDE